MIPKKIHFCWFGPNEYSPLVEKCMSSWHKKLEGWEICLWNEENSPINHPFIIQALKDKRYAFVADYVRFYVLYHHGGIYLDTDIELVKALDPLLENDFFAGFEDIKKGYIGTGIIGSIAGHVYLERVLTYYDTLKKYETSPSVLTRIYKENHIDNVCLYPYDYFFPYNPYDTEQKVKQLFYSDISFNTYAIHHWNYSWKKTKFQKILEFIKSKVR